MKSYLCRLGFIFVLGSSLFLTACEGVTPVPGTTPELKTIPIQVTPALGPQIIQRKPLTGERLGLEPVLEFVFDQPMDAEKTASAWQFVEGNGKSVQGKISWIDSRTFQFRPDRPLKAGQAYTGGFSVKGRSANGSALPQDIRLDYRVTDALVVGQVFPIDKAEDVDNKTAITVIFNKPVVALMSMEEQAKLSSPISILPSLSGTGSWVNSSVYVFQPENGLKSGTDYKVSVSGDLQDTVGVRLDSEYSWGFSTRSPTVADFGLKDIGQGFVDSVKDVLLDQAFLVTFSQPMDPKSVAAGLSFHFIETGMEVPVDLNWDNTHTVLKVTPSMRLSVASFYNLVIADSARAQDGGPLKESYRISLSTVPLPSIANVIPAGGKQDVFSPVATVNFSTRIKEESLKTHVKVVPAPKQPVTLFYHQDQNQLDIRGLEPSRQYVIRLLPGITDIYGNAINTEYSFSFETATLNPQARLVTPNYPLIYRQKSEQGIFFEYTNIDSAKLSLYSLTFEEFSALNSGTTEMDNLGKNSGNLLREWSPSLQAGRDRFARILLRLDDPLALAPGYYYLGMNAKPLVPIRRFSQGAVFIVSNDSLALKATQNEALAWLVDSNSGLPVEGVPMVFYNDLWAVVGKATTSKDGIAHLADASNVQYVRSLDDQHLSLAALAWGSGVNEGQFGVWTDYWSPIKNIFAFTYTERPLYRPSQPVYIKGIVRANDDLHYSLTGLNQVYLVIENELGRLYGGFVPLSKEGTFAYEYQLGVDAPVGNYTISVRETATNESSLSWSDFRVAEYVKPQFQVTSAADRTIALSGDDVKFSLDATYYSGGGLSQADVSWFMEMQPYFYTPPEQYGAYSFSDFDYYDYFNGGGAKGSPFFLDGQGKTNLKGHFELIQKLELSQGSPSQQVVFSSNVNDVGGNLVGSTASLSLLGSSLHAGILPETYIGKVGETQVFKLVVLDLDGKPAAKQAVSLDFAEQRWFSAVRKDEYGVSRWETSVKSIAAGTAEALTDENGLAQVSFTPPNGGEFKATVSAKDAKGRPSKAAAYMWVSSQDYIPWRQTNDRSFQLVADKNSYNPGETASILIAQPFEGEHYALITIERGHIYEKKVVKLTSNSTLYQIPITSDMAPVMYVSVMVVKGADGTIPPDFKMGMLRLNINPARQSIFVSLESDKSIVGPGDTVNFIVKTKDLDGKAVQADVSLALVDKAVLALASSNSQPLLDAFYPQRGLSVISAASIVLNAEDFNANYQETAPTGEQSGGGGGKGEGETGIVTVRENFKDTAFWQGQVLTDESGSAQVKVTLPDNLTTWQMKARAVTVDTRVGETQSELLSTRPLQIQLQTPRFFVADDIVTLGAVLHNNTAGDLSVKVSLKSEGLKLASPAAQTVNVAAGQQAFVTWDGTVEHAAKRVDLLGSAESGAYSDSTRPTLGSIPGQGLPVLAYHVTETVGSAGILREAGSISEAVILRKDVEGSLNLVVSPSLAASMTDGLNYLEDYPYLCMEQTVSRFLPNLVSLEALRLAGKSTGEVQKALDEQVKPALQRIISNQNADGGWGMWPGAESHPTTTAYVILGLVEARQAGYSFPEITAELGINYLNDHLPYPYAGNSAWQNNRAAFMLYALAQSGKPNGIQNTSLYTYRDKLDIYGKALLLQAMQIDNSKDERVQALLSDVSSAVAKSAAGSWWDEKETDFWNWNTDLRTTAIVLDTLIKVDPQNALIPDGIRWLMKHREGSHWYSTQETAWSVMALTDWLSLSGEFNTNYQYAVGLNGTLLESKQADVAHLTETTTLRLGVEKLLTDQVNYLVISRGDGPGALYYTAYMDYTLPVKDIPALDQGIMVSQQYFQADDLKTPVSAVTRGELVQVRLTLVVPESLHYLVIDNPLPAGLEAQDASLVTSQQVPTQYQSQDYDRLGWGWWYFYYKQIYDEKVVMSADYLPAGTYTITYLARASTAGRFNVLPTTAKEFYFPDVAGRSAGTEFIVKP